MTGMAALGLGTWKLAPEDCDLAVNGALEVGITHFDTAQIYENEPAVGRALAGVPRESLWITSKLWQTDMPSDRVRPSVEASLERLGVDFLDLMLVHWPRLDLTVEETICSLDACRESGLIRNIGVSNFPSSYLAQAMSVAPIANVQMEFHPYLRPVSVIELADRHGATVTAYSPLAGGAVLSDAVLAEIAGRYSTEIPAVIIAWLLARGADSALTRSTKPARLASALEGVELELSDDDMSKIDRMARGLRTCPAWYALEWDDDQKGPDGNHPAH